LHCPARDPGGPIACHTGIRSDPPGQITAQVQWEVGAAGPDPPKDLGAPPDEDIIARGRKSQLERLLADAEESPPLLHPEMATFGREKSQLSTKRCRTTVKQHG